MATGNRERESVESFKKGYERGRTDEKEFSYNRDKKRDRSRGRPPLKEAKSENSNSNDFALNFVLESILLM